MPYSKQHLYEAIMLPNIFTASDNVVFPSADPFLTFSVPNCGLGLKNTVLLFLKIAPLTELR